MLQRATKEGTQMTQNLDQQLRLALRVQLLAQEASLLRDHCLDQHLLHKQAIEAALDLAVLVQEAHSLRLEQEPAVQAAEACNLFLSRRPND